MKVIYVSDLDHSIIALASDGHRPCHFTSQVHPPLAVAAPDDVQRLVRVPLYAQVAGVSPSPSRSTYSRTEVQSQANILESGTSKKLCLPASQW
jgi:hypothetical protein